LLEQSKTFEDVISARDRHTYVTGCFRALVWLNNWEGPYRVEQALVLSEEAVLTNRRGGGQRGIGQWDTGLGEGEGGGAEPPDAVRCLGQR